MRTISVPAQEYNEDIRSLEEFPAAGVTPGLIRVTVGRLDSNGEWVVPQQYEKLEITGELYEQLMSLEPPEWAPGKPPGTYHNDDLWHCIDQVRPVRAEWVKKMISRVAQEGGRCG